MQYVWPLLIIFQLVISIIAFTRLGGAGPGLMLAGSVVVLLRTLYNLSSNWFGWGADYSNGIPSAHYYIMAVSVLGRVLFLVGVLLVAQSALRQKEVPLSRTEF